MAIAIDATTPYQIPDGGLDDPASFTHTCTGTDRYALLAICLGSGDQALTVATAPTYNGDTMTLVDNSGTPSNSSARVIVYELVAPDTGSNLTVSFAMSGGGDGRSGAIFRTFTGVHQSTPRGTAAHAVGETATATVDVSSAVDELVADFLYTNDDTTPSVGASQTSRSNTATVSGKHFASSDEAGASTTTMSWSTPDGFGWAIVGVPLKPVAASATLEQEGFRWFNDDGDEDASTGAAAQDTNITAPAGETRRLRMLLNATGDPATTQFKLQYRKVGDTPWNDVL